MSGVRREIQRIRAFRHGAFFGRGLSRGVQHFLAGVADDVGELAREGVAARASQTQREVEQSDHLIVPLGSAFGAAGPRDTLEIHRMSLFTLRCPPKNIAKV
jgi:hypothetical protein